MRNAAYLCPVVTAFDADGNLDLDANRAAWDRLVDAGIDGIVVMGSTGEFFAMDADAKRTLVDAACEHLKGRTRLLVGTGANSVAETVALSNHAFARGADGVMVVSPYYFALGPEEHFQHFARVAAAVDGLIHLYNFPARTGNDIDVDLVVRLAEACDNVVGIKDTVGDMAHTRAIIDTMASVRPGFEVLSGMDENFVHNVLAGGAGCIAALSNVRPKEIMAWVDAVRREDVAGIVAGQRLVDRLSALYSVAPVFVPVLKQAMADGGVPITTDCRASVAPLTDAHVAALRAILADADALAAG